MPAEAKLKNRPYDVGDFQQQKGGLFLGVLATARCEHYKTQDD